jgi:Protein of unknown function (DUF4242)
MKKFIIERELPGAGKLTPTELQSIALKSCDVIANLEGQYHWIQTFVTDNKLYCVHIAQDHETVMEHARRGGFPANHVVEVRSIIDPTTSV